MHSIVKKIRVKKQDSVFVYFVLEACEGWTSYSTLAFQTGDLHRDLELRIAPDFLAEVSALLRQLGDLVYEIA